MNIKLSRELIEERASQSPRGQRQGAASVLKIARTHLERFEERIPKQPLMYLCRWEWLFEKRGLWRYKLPSIKSKPSKRRDYMYFRTAATSVWIQRWKRCFHTISTFSRRRSIVGPRQWSCALPLQHIVGRHPPNLEASNDFIIAFTIHRHQPTVLDISTVMSCLILVFN